MQHPSQRSVEEILKAIQQVIESDNRESASAERRRREHAGVMLNGSDDGSLDSRAAEAAAQATDAFLVDAAIAAENDAGDILDLGLSGAAMMEDEDAASLGSNDQTPAETRADAAGTTGPRPNSRIAPERIIAQIEETLTSERAAEAMRRSLSNLSRISDAPQLASMQAGETTVEQLVRDLLRPLLAQWLEANLPPLVEKLVRDEISRIASKRG